MEYDIVPTISGESEFKKAVSSMNDSLKILSIEMKATMIQFDKGDSVINQVAADFSGMGKGLNDVGNKLNEFESTVEKSKGTTSTFGSVLKESLSKEIKDGISSTVSSLTDGIKKFMGDTVELAIDSEKALNSLQAQTGATDEEMSGLKNVMNEIYTDNFGKNIDDVANSMAVVRQQTNLSGTALKDMTEEALLLRDTFGLDVNKSVSAANTLMKQFGLTSEQAYTLIAQGAQQGLNNNGDLLDKINEYSGEYSNLGLSAEDMFKKAIAGSMGLDGQFNSNLDTLEKINDVKYDDLGSAMEGLGRQIQTSIAGPLAEELSPVVNDLIDFIKENGDGIAETIGIIAEKVGEVISWIIDNSDIIIPIIAGVAAAIGAWELSQLALNLAMEMNPIGLIIAAIVGLVAGIMTLWNTNEGFRDFITGAWDAISSVVVGAGQAIAGFFTETIPNAFNAVIAWLSNLPASIWNVIVGAIDTVINWGANLASAAGNAASNMVSWIVNTVSSLPGQMLSIGADLVRGIWNGINDTVDWILDKIKGFGKSVLKGIKSIFGINSPSTLFRDEVGKNLALGLGEGFVNEMDNVTKDIANSIPTDFEVAGTYGISAGTNNFGFSQNNSTILQQMYSMMVEYFPGFGGDTYLDGDIISKKVSKNIANSIRGAR